MAVQPSSKQMFFHQMKDELYSSHFAVKIMLHAVCVEKPSLHNSYEQYKACFKVQ